MKVTRLIPISPQRHGAVLTAISGLFIAASMALVLSGCISLPEAVKAEFVPMTDPAANNFVPPPQPAIPASPEQAL